MMHPEENKTCLAVKAACFIFFCFLFSPGIYSQTSQKTATATAWTITGLDLARSIKGISALEADVLLELNKARTNPKKYAELYIQPRLADFAGKVYKKTTMTREGASVLQECITVMSATNPLPALAIKGELLKMARTHVNTQGQTKKTGHDLPGQSFDQRIASMTQLGFEVGENIAYQENNAREIVILLLIDDGIADRGHRKNILDPVYTYAGIACGPHLQYTYMCTIDFAGLHVKQGR